jgi:hypothetical protein
MNENFTPRWGIAQLDDKGYCHIPGFIMRNASKFVYKGKDPTKRDKTVGISTQEFTVMCQIMSFKFDVATAEAKPSLSRIARYMGCSVDSVRRAKNSMEEKGALCVEYHGHEGMPNVYDFGELARQCFVFEQEANANLQAPAKMQGVANIKGGGVAKLQGLPPANLLGKEDKDKKRRKEEKEIHSPNGARAASPYSKMVEVISTVYGFGVGDTLTHNIAAVICGVSKLKGWKEHNVKDGGLTPDEAMTFFKEYEGEILPRKPITIQAEISRWRNAAARRQPAYVEPEIYDGDDVVIVSDDIYQGIFK